MLLTCLTDCRQFEDALDDLSEVCRRNKHSMDAAIQSLLPPQLYQAAKPK